jgi:hypothetical protein
MARPAKDVPPGRRNRTAPEPAGWLGRRAWYAGYLPCCEENPYFLGRIREKMNN